MRDALTSAYVTVADFVPRLIAFLLILVIGWIIARLVAKALDKVLERVGFDRAVERGGVGRMLQRSSYDASDVVSKLVFYGLLLLVLQLAFGVFGPNPVSDLLTAVIAFLPRLVVAIVIVVVAAAIAAAVKDIVSNALSGLSYGRTLGTIASVFILGLGIIAALNQVGIATTVTTPVLITVLATIGGILVVGVGGGLVKPMQRRWEGYLDTAEREKENVKQEVQRTQRERATAGYGTYDDGYGDPQYGDGLDQPYGGATAQPVGEGYEDLEQPRGTYPPPSQVDLTDDATQPYDPTQPRRRG